LGKTGLLILENIPCPTKRWQNPRFFFKENSFSKPIAGLDETISLNKFQLPMGFKFSL